MNSSHSYGFIYVIRGLDGVCKIGRTRNLPKRMEALAWEKSRPVLLFYAFVAEYGATERELHARYKDKLARAREWFHLSSDDLSEIKDYLTRRSRGNKAVRQARRMNFAGGFRNGIAVCVE